MIPNWVWESALLALFLVSVWTCWLVYGPVFSCMVNHLYFK